MTRSALEMWTVYAGPRDYPRQYVARRWVVDAQGAHPTDTVLVARTLDALRLLLPHGLYCMPRAEQDDAVIVETWL